MEMPAGFHKLPGESQLLPQHVIEGQEAWAVGSESWGGQPGATRDQIDYWSRRPGQPLGLQSRQNVAYK